MAIDWTDEIVAKMREHWKRGMSAGQSAGQLTMEYGIEFTRNMVISKRSREGLRTDPGQARLLSRKAALRRHAKARETTATPPKPAPKQAAQSKLTGLFTSGDNLPKHPLPKDESPSDYAKLYTLDELEAHQCKFYIGDPLVDGTGFCGRQKVTGLPYCVEHARRAYRAPEPRVRKPAVVRVPTFSDLEKV